MTERDPAAPVQPLDPGTAGYCQFMHGAIAERWATLWATMPAALAGEDPEGVHQVRVASRRLRAAMDVAAPCFPSSKYQPLHRAAKEITGVFGDVRDRDVLIGEFSARLEPADGPAREATERIIARLERERAAARAALDANLRRLFSGSLRKGLAREFGPAAAPPKGLLPKRTGKRT